MLQPDRIVPTTCPYCGVGCTLELHLQGDTIYKVTSPFDSPVNHGNLCVKGRFGYDFIYSPKRVTTPLIRKTPQKPGARTQAFDRSEWREASWDEALDTIAGKFKEVKEKYGPESVAFGLGEPKGMEFAFAQRFATAFGTPNVATPSHL